MHRMETDLLELLLISYSEQNVKEAIQARDWTITLAHVLEHAAWTTSVAKCDVISWTKC